jgi:hypothetical protein
MLCGSHVAYLLLILCHGVGAKASSQLVGQTLYRCSGPSSTTLPKSAMIQRIKALSKIHRRPILLRFLLALQSQGKTWRPRIGIRYGEASELIFTPFLANNNSRKSRIKLKKSRIHDRKSATYLWNLSQTTSKWDSRSPRTQSPASGVK